jgi:hypothetical protein
MRALGVVLVIAVVAAPADADPVTNPITYPATSATTSPESGWIGQVGLGGGAQYVDGVLISAGGVIGSVGWRYQDLAVLADLSASDLAPSRPVPAGTAPGALDGQMVRIGGRGSVRIGTRSDSSLWFDAGVGRESVYWAQGGSLTRTDVIAGVAGHFGMLQARLYASVARRNDHGIPTCGGPCDMPSAPEGFDTSFFTEVGIWFGR